MKNGESPGRCGAEATAPDGDEMPLALAVAQERDPPGPARGAAVWRAAILAAHGEAENCRAHNERGSVNPAARQASSCRRSTAIA